jgi:hypothetical protein
MLTDDLTDGDLAALLRDGYDDATRDLRYAGRVPRPRHPMAVALPVAATVAAAAVLGAVWASSPDGAPAPEATPSSPSTQHHDPAPVSTAKLHVAGYTFRYRTSAGGPADDLYAVQNPGAAPGDATPVDPPAGAVDGVKAWVGTDPVTGDNAIWVQSPTRNEGDVFALESPTWSSDQLVDLFLHGEPRQVPAVTR